MHLIENKAKRISLMAFLIVFWNKPMGVRKIFVKGGGCGGAMVSSCYSKYKNTNTPSFICR